MKMIRVGGLYWNVLHRLGDFQIEAAVKIQPHSAHSRGRWRGVEIHRHADRRVPAPAQAAITEVARKSSVPHQRMIQWFVVWQARGSECFNPHLLGIGG